LDCVIISFFTHLSGEEPKEFIIIMGPARSGTTLMSALLDSHKEITGVPLEIKFLQNRDKDTTFNYVDNTLDSKVSFLWNGTGYDLFNSGRIDFKNIDARCVYSQLNDLKISNELIRLDEFIEKFHNIYESCYSGSLSKDKIFLKEGNHALPEYDRIIKNFDKVKFIVLTRDPKDAYASVKRASYESDTFVMGRGCLKWCLGNIGKSFIAYEKFQISNNDSDNILFVRYEDLVTDIKSTMYKVSDFLNIKYEDSLLESTTAGCLWAGNSSTKKVFSGIAKDNVSGYRNYLDKNEIIIIDYFLSDYQKINNYSFVKYDHIIKYLRPYMFGSAHVEFKDYFRPYVRLIRFIRDAIVLFYRFTIIRK